MANMPFEIWATDSLTRVFEDTPPGQGLDFIEIKAARNEFESAQLVITARQNLTSVIVEVSDLEGEGSKVIPSQHVKLNFVGFIPLSKNTPNTPDYILERKAPCCVPDPLLDVESVDIEAGKSQPVWITIHVPRKASHGRYQGTVRVSCEEGEDEIPILLEVLPFEVAEERHLLVTNWFNVRNIAKAHGVELWSDEFFEMLARYAEIMAEHRQNVVLTPWSLVKVHKDGEKLSFDFSLFDRFVKTFFNAGVRDRLEISHVAHPKSGWGTEVVLTDVAAVDVKTGEEVKLPPEEGLGPLLSALQDHLEKRGWLERSMIHISDEPSLSNIESWKRASQFVHTYAPKLRRIEAIESTEFEGYLEVWVPKLNYFSTWGELYEKAAERGAEMWFYTCCHPFGLYPNRFLDYPLVATRSLHWINYAHKLQGYLHWGLNFWGDDPFGEPRPNLPPGDTHIIYPGKSGPLSSIRFEVMRDGIEDFEYLTLLERKLEEVKEQLGEPARHFSPRRRSEEICRMLIKEYSNCGSKAELKCLRERLIEEIISADKPPLAIVETYPREGGELIPGPIVVEVRGVVEEGVQVKVDDEEVQIRDGRFIATSSKAQREGRVRIEIAKGDFSKVIERHFTVIETTPA